MKRFSLLLGVVAVIALLTATGAFAEEAKKGSSGRGGGTMGEIVKIDGKNVTIKSSREGAADVTGECGDATEISISKPATLAELNVGDRVSITQGEKRAYGEITKKEGNVVTLKGRGGEDQAITVKEGDVIAVMAKAKFEDLKVGMQVMASVKDGKFTRISVRTPEKK